MKRTIFIFLLLCNFFVSAQQNWDFRVYHEMVNREVYLYADNNEIMPISTKFTFKLDNLRNTLPDGQIVVIPAQTKKMFIAKLTPINLNAANKFSYSNMFNFGDVTLKTFDEDYVYDLPFAKGKTYRIYQGYNGKFSHSGALALDFSLQIGDAVHAARTGIVIETEDSHNQGCPSSACSKYNNRIVIMHSDGTFADYAHLKYRGSAVKKGDTIQKGQLLGYSGNTGFSSGPHLHFSVFINGLDGNRTFIKTKFKTSVGETYLQEGKLYTKN